MKTLMFGTKHGIAAFTIMLIGACGQSAPPTPSTPSPPVCDMRVVLSEMPIAGDQQCAGVVDGAVCVNFGAEKVPLQMRDIRRSGNSLGWPCIEFSINPTERAACDELARAHPGHQFAFVHEGTVFQRFQFSTPISTPGTMQLVPSTGHRSEAEADVRIAQLSR